MGNRKLPFGYKMVMGEIVVHPQEAQAVQGIYARYLTGASFNDITDHLKEKGPPYDADKPWNKNMVARILEDGRYAGTERFPAILSAEQLQEAAQRRSERKPAVQITEAQKTLRRLCNGRPSVAVESQVLSLLNSLAAAPEQIKPQPQTVNRGELFGQRIALGYKNVRINAAVFFQSGQQLILTGKFRYLFVQLNDIYTPEKFPFTDRLEVGDEVGQDVAALVLEIVIQPEECLLNLSFGDLGDGTG